MKNSIEILLGILIITILLVGCAPQVPEKSLIEEVIPSVEEIVPEKPKEIISAVPKEAKEEIPTVPKEEVVPTEEEAPTIPEKEIEKPAADIIISVVYDNYEFDPRLTTSWGISCLVEIDGKTILFDTGGDSPTLLGNMEKLGIDPPQIDIVVLSHIHGDHVGGLYGFLEVNNKVTVYIPSSFPDSFRERITKAGASFIDVDKPTKIWNNVYSTGELGTWIKEQSLIIDTDKGLVVISGCAHPGIANIVRKAKELLDNEVYLVLGGFHSPPLSVVQEFRELGVQKTAPSHCTGERATEAFKDEYKDNFIKSGVGKIIKIWKWN